MSIKCQKNQLWKEKIIKVKEFTKKVGLGIVFVRKKWNDAFYTTNTFYYTPKYTY